MNSSDRLTRRTFIEKTARAAAVGVGASRVAAAAGAAATTRPGRPRGWQVGCFTRPWGEHHWRVALDAIAEAGFKYAGLMTTKAETRLVISAATKLDEAHRIGEEVAKRGLKIASVYGGGFAVARSLEAGVADLHKLIDNCAAVRSRTLMIGGNGKRELQDRYYRAVADVCDYAAEKHVGIVLKPHGGLNATGPQCRKIIEHVGHENFTLWYDPGNIYYSRVPS